MNVSLELSYLHSKIKESPLSRETLAPESLIFILEIIKTSTLSKRLHFRQLGPVPWIANLNCYKYFEHRPIYWWEHSLKHLNGKNCLAVRLLLESFFFPNTASAYSQTGLRYIRYTNHCVTAIFPWEWTKSFYQLQNWKYWFGAWVPDYPYSQLISPSDCAKSQKSLTFQNIFFFCLKTTVMRVL